MPTNASRNRENITDASVSMILDCLTIILTNRNVLKIQASGWGLKTGISDRYELV